MVPYLSKGPRESYGAGQGPHAPAPFPQASAVPNILPEGRNGKTGAVRPTFAVHFSRRRSSPCRRYHPRLAVGCVLRPGPWTTSALPSGGSGLTPWRRGPPSSGRMRQGWGGPERRCSANAHHLAVQHTAQAVCRHNGELEPGPRPSPALEQWRSIPRRRVPALPATILLLPGREARLSSVEDGKETRSEHRPVVAGRREFAAPGIGSALGDRHTFRARAPTAGSLPNDRAQGQTR
jgi:hypothetical protein